MFAKKKVVVIGSGISGKGALQLLLREKAKVFVYGDDELCVKKLCEDVGGTPVKIKDFPTVLSTCEYAVLSPGISINSNVAVMAQALGVKVMSEIELGASCCRAKIYAVTGTNGKSSMVNLIGKLLENVGKNAVVCGNVGKSFSGVADKIPEDGYAVVETSSFQLESSTFYKPDLAVMLNLKPDHVDRHITFQEYARVKSKIFENMDESGIAIGNYNDEYSRKAVELSRAKKYFFSSSTPVPEGVYLDGEEFVAVSSGRRFCVGKLSDVCGVKTPIENVVALLCVTLACNVPFGVAYKTLSEFVPMPHTLQTIGKKGKVCYIDDSKGTNISATLCAVQNTDGKIVLICGGRTKGENYAELFGNLPERIVSTVCIGENANELMRLSNSAGILSKTASDVNEAVRLASLDIKEIGGTVLFSPATASFDCYKNYAERGEAFINAVKNYASE